MDVDPRLALFLVGIFTAIVFVGFRLKANHPDKRMIDSFKEHIF